MAQITREISVDVAKANIFQAIVAKQNDNNSRFLKVTLTNEGEPLEIASSSTVTINALREDGEAKAFLGTVNADNTVTVPLTNWILALDGNVKCDITVLDTENRKLTTTLFTLAVEESAYLGTDISEDDENYDLLIQLLDTYTTTKANCEAATAGATSAAQLANTKAALAGEKAALADEKATAANTAAQAATAAKTELEATMSEADDILTEMESATTAAKTATTKANTATSNATKATTAANNAATAAENAKSATETATENANSAADNANSKATLADQKATLADQKATAAQNAATAATTAKTAAETATTNAETATAAATAATEAATSAANAANAAAENVADDIAQIENRLGGLTFTVAENGILTISKED